MLYGTDHLAIYDASGGTLTGTVDLSAYNDTDDVGPEPSSIVEVDGMLYVGLNRLNRDGGWVDDGGMVVEVDCDTEEATRAWDVGGNTQVHAWEGSGKVLATARAYDQDPSGLYVIDPAQGTVSNLIDTGVESLSSIAAFEDAAIAISLASDYSSYDVHCIDLTTGDLTTLEQTTSYLTSARANDLGEAWITASNSWIDPKAPSGLFVYDIASCSSLTGSDALELSLAPNSVAFY